MSDASWGRSTRSHKDTGKDDEEATTGRGHVMTDLIEVLGIEPGHP